MRRLLVPLDGSDRGDQILSFLDRMLPEVRAQELVLLRVLGEGEHVEAARARLAETTRRARSSGLIATPLVVVGDEPADEVLKVAGLIRPTLMALSTHGAGQSPEVRGSVAAKVVAGSPVPILMIGRQALPIDPGPGLSRVLVALDGSRAANAVLSLVGELARPSDAEVLLLTVDGGDDATDLEVARAKLLQAGVDRVRVLRARGDVAEGLLDATRREAVDLLAMGARGKTSGAGLGSVARTVAQRCDCPLLLVR